jgi:acyl-CoA thioester hydrolase
VRVRGDDELHATVRRGEARDAGDDVTAVRGRNVYVVVSTDDWAKREIPAVLREALTSVAGQGQNAMDGGIEKGTVSP